MIGEPLMLMESCDVGKNIFQIIARSMPYFENDFQLCIEISGIVGKSRGFDGIHPDVSRNY
jgi:hypothetical protein